MGVDTIIVGSGIGGLTTAALLAKSGKRVMVLEQHTVAGGTTHSFIDHGVDHEVGRRADEGEHASKQRREGCRHEQPRRRHADTLRQLMNHRDHHGHRSRRAHERRQQGGGHHART